MVAPSLHRLSLMSDFLNYVLADPGTDSDFLARLSSALVLVLLGFLAALVVRMLLARLMRGLLSLVSARFPMTSIGTSRINRLTVQLLPRIVFWSIFLVFLALGTETLGLPVFTAWMAKLLEYLPAILTAALVILAGIWGGIVLKESIFRMAAAARLPYARLLGGLCQTAVIAVATVIAASQLGVDISFLLVLTGILLGALLFSVALAFGLGARTMVSNIISCHYIRGIYRVGNAVEIDGVKGNIIKITGAFVVIETEAGQVSVPAKSFSKTISTLIR